MSTNTLLNDKSANVMSSFNAVAFYLGIAGKC
jgi:hypothetical protein